MIVCLCKISTDRDIADAIADGAHTVEQVGQRCGAGTGCGSCIGYIRERIEESGNTCPGDECVECPASSTRRTRRSYQLGVVEAA